MGTSGGEEETNHEQRSTILDADRLQFRSRPRQWFSDDIPAEEAHLIKALWKCRVKNPAAGIPGKRQEHAGLSTGLEPSEWRGGSRWWNMGAVNTRTAANR